MPDTVTGKRFVIVGGSSGIGFAVAKLVLEQGAGEVIIASSSQDKVNAAVKSLQSHSTSGKVIGKTLDLKATDKIPEFFKDLGNFDHLVSTAGGALPFQKFPAETDIEATIANSNDRFWSVLKMIQASYKQINTGGSITLTSGTTIRRPMPGWSALSGIAGAVETATRNLALDMAPLRVNCVVPGVVDTPVWNGMPDEVKAKAFEEYAKKFPVGHVGQPEEIAESYLYCFRCTYLTGTSLFVDGGGILV